MKVIPLAFDSMGVRSMATFIQTDVGILIDPGLDLAPRRYGLPPSRAELKRAEELTAKINQYADKTDIFVITHYHHDHYFPEAEFYEGKILLLKHPRTNINYNQKKRAKLFLRKFRAKAREIEYAEDREFAFSGTNVKFSAAVPHGELLSKTGFVVMCSVSHAGEKLVFASDVQGPQTDEAVRWMVDQNPDMLILSGYPTYLTQHADQRLLEECGQRLTEILARTKAKTIILDHHLTRDLEYRDKIDALVRKALSMGRTITTAAEYVGMEPDLLEATRKELHQVEKGGTSLHS